MGASNLDAFADAFRMIINLSKMHAMWLIDKQEKNLFEAIELLEKAKDEEKYIHIAGMGRSKLAGMIVGELLKDLGFHVSVIGDILSRPVKPDDIVLAISASGWTTTTCFVVEEALKLGAKVIAFTATPGSKIDRLADVSIYLPGKSEISDLPYIIRQLIGKHKTPLTPMGTLPETNTILVGVGLVKLLESRGASTRVFKDSIEIVLNNAERSFKGIMENTSELERIIEIVSMCVQRKKPKIYFIGTGIGKLIALMSAMRFQHLGLNITKIDDWKFRERKDILIAISSSGESTFTLLYAEEAKRSGMILISLTANPDSTLAKLSDTKLLLTDFAERKDYIKLRIRDEKPSAFIPAFEYAGLLTLEGIVAQIAENFHIREEDMRKLHANIE